MAPRTVMARKSASAADRDRAQEGLGEGEDPPRMLAHGPAARITARPLQGSLATGSSVSALFVSVNRYASVSPQASRLVEVKMIDPPFPNPYVPSSTDVPVNRDNVYLVADRSRR